MADSDSYRQKKAAFARMLTVYGRKPVLEALTDPDLSCHALHLADSNRSGGIVSQIEALAGQRQVAVLHHSRAALSRISRNGRQDQGVALDVVCPAFSGLDDFLDELGHSPQRRLLAMDGVTNPQNLGMIIRSATAAGIDGILWSARGNAALGPLVIKASAGTVFKAPLVRCEELPGALGRCRDRGMEICALSADAGESVFEHRPEGHCVYILGNETTGISTAVTALASTRLSIPMHNGVESLNVAVTASLIAYAAALQRQNH